VSDELSVTYVAIPTTITAAAIPPQQFIGQSVAIKGGLSSNGALLGNVHVTLYNADDVIERVSVATTVTDASGAYQFTLSETVPGQHSYVVRALGTGTHASAESALVSVAYVSVPTTITAAVKPGEQCVGHDVTITGRLNAGGAPLTDAPVSLYNADDVAQGASAADTTTDDAGYYQFRVNTITPGRHSYVVHAPAKGKYAPAQSVEIAVAYVAIPTAITATATSLQREVTITGQLLARGAPLADAPVSLYNADDVEQDALVAEAKTDASGYYEFHLETETTATSHVYRVYYDGDNAHTPAQSTDVLVHRGTPSPEAPPVTEPVATPQTRGRLRFARRSRRSPVTEPVATPQTPTRLARYGVLLLFVLAAIVVALAVLLMRL
jgi:5-hydroxyisourate hydrolase-like protein (transthyretin family)